MYQTHVSFDDFVKAGKVTHWVSMIVKKALSPLPYFQRPAENKSTQGISLVANLSRLCAVISEAAEIQHNPLNRASNIMDVPPPHKAKF